jgi:Sec-independent protein translocase protein TatA
MFPFADIGLISLLVIVLIVVLVLGVASRGRW